MACPDWSNVPLGEIVEAAVDFLRHHKPLGIAPRAVVDPGPGAPCGASVWWEITKGQKTVGVHVQQTTVQRPLQAVRLAVSVSWPAVTVDAADAVAQAILHRSVADVACVLRKSLAGHHWSLEERPMTKLGEMLPQDVVEGLEAMKEDLPVCRLREEADPEGVAADAMLALIGVCLKRERSLPRDVRDQLKKTVAAMGRVGWTNKVGRSG